MVANLFIPKIKSMKLGLTGSKIKSDLIAGGVVGLESVPDGLATGVLGGVNPIAGVYGSVYGFLGGALFARSSFMAVQTTGAMAIIVADQNLSSFGDEKAQAQALATLTILSGLFMLVATVAGAARLLRYVPNAVMVGFVNAIGVNIILGQMGDLTGYSSKQPNRLFQTVDTFFHLGDLQLAILAVGLASLAGILWFRETRLGPLGLIVGVAAASVLAIYIGGPVQLLRDVADIPNSIPGPRLPSLDAIPTTLIGAASIAFVGLIQGAGVTSGLPEPDDVEPDASQDFASQAAGNGLAAFFGGMPVGGSMSGSALNIGGGAKSRMSYVYASVIMIAVMVLLAGIIARVAMPALAGLLMIVGFDSLRPHRASQIIKSGRIDTLTMAVTFILCLLMPVQYAVIVGVVVSMVLYVVENSSGFSFQRILIDNGKVEEEPTPETLGSNQVVVLQPYGNLFFGSAPEVRGALPQVTAESTNSVVILRLRGMGPLGFAVSDLLKRYTSDLQEVGSKLMLISNDKEALDQFKVVGLTARVGKRNVYEGSRWYGDTTTSAAEDAERWVRTRISATDRNSNKSKKPSQNPETTNSDD